MRKAAENGSFDAFVLEYQTYVNDTKLSKNYKFIPFGYEHTNPLVAISSTSEEKKEILKLFAEYAEENGQKLAKDDGFLYFVMRKDHGAKTAIRDISDIYNAEVICKEKGFFVIKCFLR